MLLYNLTLERTGSVNCCCYGSFSAPKQQEIVVGRGQYLELQKVASGGRLQSVAVHEIFGVVRSLQPFRLHGAPKDYLVVGSDSGRIVILEYDQQRARWNKVHQETYGKSGCRRAVPGQYLAADPRGRTVMIAAVEKQKFVYILNRDAESKLTISSPLEAHKSQTVTYSCVGVDVGFENPVFATIEVDHSDLDEDPSAPRPEKQLVYYELDLGLNHVVRKWSTKIEDSANMLVAVPGGDDGPGGVLVCSENYVTYCHIGHDPVRQVVPRRQDMLPQNGLLLVAAALHKQKGTYFFLIQSEYGDLYKVTLDCNSEKDEVRQVHIKYFDTVPVAASIVILRAGYLYVAAEFGNHRLYQFQGIGDDDDDAIIGVMTIREEGAAEHEQEILPLFNPRALSNLVLIDEVDSLSPLLHTQALDPPPSSDLEGKRVYALCGRGPSSSLRVLQQGLSLAELGASDLPGLPERVWTVKKQFQAEYCDYIVVSFLNATLVLSVGDTVEEVHDSGFWGATATLVVRTMQDDSLLQVHQSGLRHIRRDRRINEWKAPGRRAILCAAANERQVIIAVAGGEVIAFELDQYGGLNEINKVDLGGEKDVISMAVSPVPEGRLRSRFLALGFQDKRVMLLSLDPEDRMAVLARQSCNSEPEDLCILQMEGESQERQLGPVLFIGLRNGILVRSALDSVTGDISDTRTRFCGTRPCRLVRLPAEGREALCVLSSRSWLAYTLHGRYQLQPLSAEPYEHVAPFASEQCPEGLVTIRKSQVKILSLERLGGCFHQTTVPLKATPRGFVKHPLYPYLITIETDHKAYTDLVKQGIRKDLRKALVEEDDEEAKRKIEEQDEDELPEREFGTIKAEPGTWCSYIRIWDPNLEQTHDLIELEDNQAAFSLSTCVFDNTMGEVHLVVGTVKDLVPSKGTFKSGLLLTFRFKEDGKVLELVHKTVVTDGIPYAMHPHQGRLLVGIGNTLVSYRLGRRKLLRWTQCKQIPNPIQRISSVGSRIIVGDAGQSVHFVRYKKADKQLVVFADDTVPRWVSALCPLDAHTVAVGDKFGNLSVLRLGPDVSEEIDNDPGVAGTTTKWLWDRGVCNGAPQKCECVATVHLGGMVTSIEKVQLAAGGMEVILYATIGGAVGALLPIQSREDGDLLRLLEMHLRQENPPLCGRDHMSYRSYYAPVRNVVDGDFCELYSTLPYSTQQEIAEELNRLPNDVKKRLEEIRNKVL
eukprot:TRINITY_DN70920_c0_g1_i1.p1 TRINITY_DN70920_c0_g1~~TRINITY_DN70920_c0_g1_i1.p1  ORF type:complete len:1217 (+),score=407.47 TRINITY_DN70920_c0_g1_i1:127-3777(+)